LLQKFSVLGAQATDIRFQFEKRSQLFVGVHNKALSVAAMRINNPDCSALTIQR
jgi:hypothetical protein